MVKNMYAMWENRVRSLGWEDPLEMEMATHSSNLAWRIPWTGEPGRLQSIGSQRVGHSRAQGQWKQNSVHQNSGSGAAKLRGVKNSLERVFPGSPVVKTSPSNAGGVDSTPVWRTKIPHVSGPKKQNKTEAVL